MFVLSKTLEKLLCAKKIIYDCPRVEQFLNFSTELFNQGVSYSVLVSAAAHVTGNEIQTNP